MRTPASPFEVAKKIAQAQRRAFGTDWVLSQIIGDEIPHAHIWVFPSNEVQGDREDLAGNAEKIRVALAKALKECTAKSNVLPRADGKRRRKNYPE